MRGTRVIRHVVGRLSARKWKKLGKSFKKREGKAKQKRRVGRKAGEKL